MRRNFSYFPLPSRHLEKKLAQRKTASSVYNLMSRLFKTSIKDAMAHWRA